MSHPDTNEPGGPSPTGVDFHLTLWPAFPHFPRFAGDVRVQGIRLNSAMMEASEIDEEFERLIRKARVPLWFDVKGMQLRIREVICGPDQDHLEFRLNRPVTVKTPCRVEFKAGEDAAECIEVKDGGTHFVFRGGPFYEVREGESIHIRHPHEVSGPVLLDYEVEKIERVLSLGFTQFYLSYVWEQRHVDEFREAVGREAFVMLKIENRPGLDWIANEWKKQERTSLVAARGDLYVEVNRPHEIMMAVKLLIEKDPTATVGSRLLLSLVDSGVPRCADLSDLAWLYDIGYRSFLLCDELCLKDELLGRAVNVFDAFRDEYAR